MQGRIFHIRFHPWFHWNETDVHQTCESNGESKAETSNLAPKVGTQRPMDGRGKRKVGRQDFYMALALLLIL